MTFTEKFIVMLHLSMSRYVCVVFPVHTVSYGPSFFPFDLWPKRKISTVFDGFGNDFYSRGTASNF